MTPNSAEIRRRAYALWEREGRPHGRDVEHWREAELAFATESSDERLDEGLEETFPASDTPSALLRSA